MIAACDEALEFLLRCLTNVLENVRSGGRWVSIRGIRGERTVKCFWVTDQMSKSCVFVCVFECPIEVFCVQLSWFVFVSSQSFAVWHIQLLDWFMIPRFWGYVHHRTSKGWISRGKWGSSLYSEKWLFLRFHSLHRAICVRCYVWNLNKSDFVSFFDGLDDWTGWVELL